jgi:octaheme c-type cytochrome (tetrathionate reductase family)
MRDFKYIWLAGLGTTLLTIAIPIWLFALPLTPPRDDPWAGVPQRAAHTDHSTLITAPLTTGPEVTRLCLTCHADAAAQVQHTSHWLWQSEPVLLEGRDEPVAIGKANLLNNFCIGVQSNWASCTRCHTGYGWGDANFDFTNQENVDCLACHDQSGTYTKAAKGLPADGVDLVAAARSVGTPSRVNCGSCHFNGGGGNGVKHGDLDESMYYPPAAQDVHMGRAGLLCVDCHQATDHQIRGRAISVSADNANQAACTDCHSLTLHTDERIVSHLDSLACQTCHIPAMALRDPTKVSWDWSTAGQDLPEDPHEYLKIKGTFVYETNVLPSYAWFDGTVDRYLLGDVLDPNAVTVLNPPNGSIDDPNARIFPFKIHLAQQPYDTVYNYLLQPQTTGPEGYWATFDWNSAFENGSQATGLPYSGSYGFTETAMYWVTTHMVQPAANALQCADCHGESTRFDWQALGYYGDPLIWGGRDATIR